MFVSSSTPGKEHWKYPEQHWHVLLPVCMPSLSFMQDKRIPIREQEVPALNSQFINVMCLVKCYKKKKVSIYPMSLVFTYTFITSRQKTNNPLFLSLTTYIYLYIFTHKHTHTQISFPCQGTSDTKPSYWLSFNCGLVSRQTHSL